MVVSAETGLHYTWGAGCDGWVLAPGPELLVIEERMPAKSAEIRHVHDTARQFFYVLAGTLTMVLGEQRHCLAAGQGIEIAPGAAHQARNDGDGEARFLVVSTPTTRGDRRDLGGT
ncbi:MAG: cupin domain-containing protein [Hyphomicrobiaceae bacterium]|nr:cupin domain-containing protein [Hyphomicrobiaceae bacterium]